MLLLAACSEEEQAAVLDLRTPEERLDALAPGLSHAVARVAEDPAALHAVLLAADPDLVRLLVPPAPTAWRDEAGDGVGPDLLQATVRVEGPNLVGEVVSTPADAVVLWLDGGGGPAPDVHLALGRGGATWARWSAESRPAPLSIPAEIRVERDRLAFSIPLAHLPPLQGAVVALVGDPAAGPVDSGPAGVLGPPALPALELLDALVSPIDPDTVVPWPGSTAGQAARLARADADLAIAIALAFGSLRPQVDTAVLPELLADARARLAFADEVDAWLERHDLDWRVHGLPAPALLLWAWPAGENLVYGAFPAGWEARAWSRERYRYHVPTAATLVELRDVVPIGTTRANTAQTIDDAVWELMTYRAHDAGMAALCDLQALEPGVCFAWETDRDAGVRLGPVDGRGVPLDKATSPTLQLERLDAEGDFIGDCTTATTLTMAAWQAVGIAPLAVGYAGPDWYRPTHNQPLYFDGRRWTSTQAAPSATWADQESWVYVVLPSIAGPQGWAMARESTGWARGGAMPAGRAPYRDLGHWLEQGVSTTTVQAWLEAPWRGEWPRWAPP